MLSSIFSVFGYNVEGHNADAGAVNNVTEPDVCSDDDDYVIIEEKIKNENTVNNTTHDINKDKHIDNEEKQCDLTAAPSSPVIRPKRLPAIIRNNSKPKAMKRGCVAVCNNNNAIVHDTDVGADAFSNYHPLDTETIESIVAAIEAKCADNGNNNNTNTKKTPHTKANNKKTSAPAVYNSLTDDMYDDDNMSNSSYDYDDDFSLPSHVTVKRTTHMIVPKPSNCKKQRCRKLYDKSHTKAVSRARDAKVDY